MSCTATYFADCFEDSPGLSQWVQEEAAPDRLVTTTAIPARQGSRVLQAQARVHDSDFPMSPVDFELAALPEKLAS
ncbi:hypothetical protein [Archangium sp.]|uniref:hypothetical protein n=1 Tax=Archangium sp. TaxID=1872627 RepID=UPI002D69BAB7|nr:hypothetical protein [Archangium sp.]HYO53041.1 hypothetical protein [Archangium sp.]